MAEKLKRDSTDTDYEETTAPQNPPNSMLKERARTGWLASSLGTLLIFFIVVAAAFGWVLVRHELGKDARISPDPQAVGTSGQRLRENSPGGFDPAPEYSRTRDELKFRGAEAPKTKQGAEAPKEEAAALTAKELTEKK
jgi:hypothetical protein